MQTIQRLIAALRGFWANHQQRRTIMWVLGAVGLLVVAYGAYTYIDARREYNRIEDGKDRFLAAFPTAEVQGEMQTDLSEASQTDLLWLALQRRNQAKADQRSSQGIMLTGIGIVVLGLAYLVAPTGKPAASPDDGAPPLT
ncbi:MAG: hypothetical protein M5U29_08345 [Anaerolineae bacterium]|nr:hypothetical protein [Anaerolineae bacterium]